MRQSVYLLRASLICTFAILLLNAVSDVSAQSKSYSDSAFDFPYQAIVRHDDTKIFSGPASVHYATDKVAQGEIVQVYRHDPGGWCAIRPNKGSFSLIPEAAVEVVEDGVGEITQDNTQAWVGTRLGSVEKPLWQIKLEAGEEVKILGEASWPSPEGHSTLWYQIAPPAGEFRWVRFTDLQTPPIDTRPVADALTSELVLSKKTKSGFKYDELPEADLPERETDGDESSDGGFKYVALEKKKTDKMSKERSVIAHSVIARSEDKHTDSERTDSSRTASERAASDWEWSHSNLSKSGQGTSPHVATRDRNKRQTSNLNEPAKHSSEGIDFKFRPIGQTASLSGSFKSVPKEKVVRDSGVAQAAYQSPVFDSVEDRGFRSSDYDRFSQSPNQFESSTSRWQRGRSELADRKMQYEARYDQFNDRVQVDRRDIEDSFGVTMEDLPDHQRSSINRQVGNLGPYQSYPAYSYPPADRYASLNTEFEIHPRSRLAEKLTPRLSKIEEQLTNEMLKRPNEWQLADVELTVGQIYSQTSNPVERLQAQRIMDKISKWKVIRNGYTKNFQATGETFGTSVRSLGDARGSRFAWGDGFQSSGGAISAGSEFSSANYGPANYGPGNFGSSISTQRGAVIGSGVDTDFEMNAKFDAAGWLTELVSEDRNNRPVYVLVNDSGKITHHVVGTPGLNLHRYLKSKIGVSGRQGYNNRMKLDHITAETIDELQR